MSIPEKLIITAASAATILSLSSLPATAAITIMGPGGAGYDPSDPLGGLPAGATGTVSLNPTPIFVLQNPWQALYLAPPAAGSTILTRFAAEAATQFAGWTAVTGAALNGTLTINEYDARDYVAEPGFGLNTPRGGADMNATYTRAAGDPAIADLRFISLFTDNTGANGALVSHIDPFPNDDNLPWYYTEAETAANSGANTTTFDDHPSDPVTAIPFNRTVRFETYLATFDNATKVATIRDGWKWGYDVVATKPVPEPLTIVGSGAAFGFGTFFKRQINKKQKQASKKAS